MSWIVAILLALGAFAAIAFAFRIPRKSWTLLLTALALGLAGYGLQASPNKPGSPTVAQREIGGQAEQMIQLRKEIIPPVYKSRSAYLVTSDAYARQGQFGEAVGLLRGVVHNNPRDGEAWLAIAITLELQADGRLTPPAVYAYRQAATAMPRSAGPAFFFGLALIRAGDLAEGRAVWAEQLAALPEGAPGRAILADRLARLDELVKRMAEQQGISVP